MLTPLVPDISPQKGGRDPYHGCLYFDPDRQPVVVAGDVLVPVKAFSEVDGDRVYWSKPEAVRVLARDFFPTTLPLSKLLAGREGKVIQVETTPFNLHESLTWSLLCSQSSAAPGTTFETWYKDSTVFNYEEFCQSHMMRTVPVIARSIAEPRFIAPSEPRPKVSLTPKIIADEAAGCTAFKIRVREDGKFEDMPINSEILKRHSPFFRKALAAGTLTHQTGVLEISCSIVWMRELVYYLTHDAFHPDITMNSCLGLLSLNQSLGEEKQNNDFEAECFSLIKQKLTPENCKKVIKYARKSLKTQLFPLVEEFMKGQKLNLIGHEICSVQDCVEYYHHVPTLAEWIAADIREELILRPNPTLWKEAYDLSKGHRRAHTLFEELYRACEVLATKNPDLLGD